MIRMNTLKDEVKVMEEQIKDQLVRLSEVVEEASKNKNSSNQMKWVLTLIMDSSISYYLPWGE